MNAAGDRSFDLVVVGGGSGGLAGAFRAAEHGARVALCEPNALGGTCVNVGCVPKKAMWLAAHVGASLRMAATLGFPAADATLDWPTFLFNRQRYIDNIHASYRRRLDEASIVVYPSKVCFLDANTVVCADGTRLRGERILIATGGHPVRPDIPGAELGGVSDDLFRWTAAPSRVALIGGGYIAVELAGVLQALGSRVDLYVRGSRLLAGFDAELTAQLAEHLRHDGVGLHFDYAIGALEADGVHTRVCDTAGAASIAYDAVLFATGRAPNSGDLGLAEIGVACDKQGHVMIDAGNATKIENIHAVGDVTNDPALTPVAIAAARRLMDRLYAGADAMLDRTNIPTVVFSHPPLATVGLSEDDARARHGDAVQVFRANFRPMLAALVDTPTRSLFKLICVGEERRVIGIHLLGDSADEILQGFAVAMKRGITLDDLRDTVAIHPTSAEEVVLMR